MDHGEEARLVLPVVGDETVLWRDVRDGLTPSKVEPDASVEQWCGSKGLLRNSRAYAVLANNNVTHHRLSVNELDLNRIQKLGLFDKLIASFYDTFRHKIKHLL